MNDTTSGDPNRQNARPFPPVHVDSNGTWTHQGRPIVHPAILLELKKCLRFEPDGSIWSVMQDSRVKIEPEFALLEIVSVQTHPRVRFELDDGTSERPGPAVRVGIDRSNRLNVTVKQGRAWARLSRNAHLVLQHHVVQASKGFALELDGRRHPIQRVEARPAH